MCSGDLYCSVLYTFQGIYALPAFMERAYSGTFVRLSCFCFLILTSRSEIKTKTFNYINTHVFCQSFLADTTTDVCSVFLDNPKTKREESISCSK